MGILKCLPTIPQDCCGNQSFCGTSLCCPPPPCLKLELLQMLGTFSQQSSGRVSTANGSNGHSGGTNSRVGRTVKKTRLFSPETCNWKLGAGKATCCHLLVIYCVAASNFHSSVKLLFKLSLRRWGPGGWTSMICKDPEGGPWKVKRMFGVGTEKERRKVS